MYSIERRFVFPLPIGDNLLLFQEVGRSRVVRNHFIGFGRGEISNHLAYRIHEIWKAAPRLPFEWKASDVSSLASACPSRHELHRLAKALRFVVDNAVFASVFEEFGIKAPQEDPFPCRKVNGVAALWVPARRLVVKVLPGREEEAKRLALKYSALQTSDYEYVAEYRPLLFVFENDGFERRVIDGYYWFTIDKDGVLIDDRDFAYLYVVRRFLSNGVLPSQYDVDDRQNVRHNLDGVLYD